MQIVIDIPEKVKEIFDNATKDDIYGNYYDFNSIIGNAIKNGKPYLDYGQWISEKVDGEDWKGCKKQFYQPISCSKCHSPSYYKSNYCPNCGIKMVEPQESEDN